MVARHIPCFTLIPKSLSMPPLTGNPPERKELLILKNAKRDPAPSSRKTWNKFLSIKLKTCNFTQQKNLPSCFLFLTSDSERNNLHTAAKPEQTPNSLTLI